MVLPLLSRGMTQEQVASYWGRDDTTVKSYLRLVQRALGLNKQGLEEWV